MREIKFRAVYIDGDGKVNLIPVGNLDLFIDNSFNVNNEFPVRILEQFTGLKDKNGVEIYEGDIVRCGANEYDNPGKVHKVVYSLNSFVYVRDDEPDQTAYYSPYLTEVIGNVHESPDLLK